MANPLPIVQPTDSQKPYPDVENEWDPHPIASFTAPKNTDVLTSADMNKTDVQSSAIPTMGASYGYGRNYASMPIGNVQSTMAQKPTDYLSPEAREYMGYGNAALGGAAAGGQINATPNGSDAALQVVGSGIGGAAAGAAYGGPVGAAIGGAVGLVTGGINAYVGTKAARQQRREQEKIRQQIAAKDEARYQQARADAQQYFNTERADTQEQLRYNRRMEAIQSQWQAQESARRALNDAIQNNAQLKMMLTQEVR
jgi:hypothetical protein